MERYFPGEAEECSTSLQSAVLVTRTMRDQNNYLKASTFAKRVADGVSQRLFFLIRWLCLDLTFNKLIPKVGGTINSGAPKDAIKSPNTLTGIIRAPLTQKVLYPFFMRRRIGFSPIACTSLVFFILAVVMAYSASLQ